MNTNTNISDNNNYLRIIKIAHTIIWIVMSFSVAYVFYCGVSGRINIFTWLSIALITGEGLALLLGKGDCPLHLYAQKISGKNILNDTYLPDWIFFKGHKVIMSIIFLIGFILIVMKSVSLG